MRFEKPTKWKKLIENQSSYEAQKAPWIIPLQINRHITQNPLAEIEDTLGGKKKLNPV